MQKEPDNVVSTRSAFTTAETVRQPENGAAWRRKPGVVVYGTLRLTNANVTGTQQFSVSKTAEYFFSWGKELPLGT